MFSLGTMLKAERHEAQRSVAAATDEDTFLAAALAATLVEYRRHVQQQDPPPAPKSTHWRTVARVEGLMGSAPFGR